MQGMPAANTPNASGLSSSGSSSSKSSGFGSSSGSGFGSGGSSGFGSGNSSSGFGSGNSSSGFDRGRPAARPLSAPDRPVLLPLLSETDAASVPLQSFLLLGHVSAIAPRQLDEIDLMRVELGTIDTRE